MAVLVVVEGLTRQLAEEVAAVQGAAGTVVPLQGAARRREGLRAAAAAEAAKGQNTQQISISAKGGRAGSPALSFTIHGGSCLFYYH